MVILYTVHQVKLYSRLHVAIFWYTSEVRTIKWQNISQITWKRTENFDKTLESYSWQITNELFYIYKPGWLKMPPLNIKFVRITSFGHFHSVVPTLEMTKSDRANHWNL